MIDWLDSLHPAIPHLGLALSLLWAAYILVLASWIALQKREPIATLSWLLSLALLPVLGFVIYHFLGPQRIQRQQIKRLRAKALMQGSWTSNSEATAPSPLMRLAHASTGFAPSSCTRIHLLSGGGATFDAITCIWSTTFLSRTRPEPASAMP
jgi:cardiolipin synthase